MRFRLWAISFRFFSTVLGSGLPALCMIGGLENQIIPTQKTIAIVGPGNVGRVMALALHHAGFRVTEIITRAKPASLRKARVLAKRVGASASSIAIAQLDSN